MKKRMEAIEVDITDDGKIQIYQEDERDGSLVTISPDQVDTLIQWLKEAKAEATAPQPVGG